MKIFKKITQNNFLYLLLLIILILIFFSKYLSGENLFFATDEASSDLLDFNYPQRVYLAQHLQENKIPLWTPYQSNGFPFLAEAQSGVFYPINLFLFKFFDPSLAFNWSIITAFIILSLGMFFFLKSLHLSSISAFFSAALIPFSGFFITQLKHVQLIQTAAFLPFCFLFVEKIIQTQQKRHAIFLSIAFSLSVLAGHLPTAYSILIFSLVYFFCRLSQYFKTRPESLRPVLLFLLSLILTLGMSAVQLIPTLEMIPHSTRNILTTTTPQANFELKQLLVFLTPFYFGDPSQGSYDRNLPSFWETSGYIGIIPLLLVLSIFRLKKRDWMIFEILLAISLFFVLGIPLGLFQFIWNLIPGLSFIRLSSRLLLFVDFSLLILTAFSIEKIIFSKLKYKQFLWLILLTLSIFDLWSHFITYNGSVSAQKWTQPTKTASFLSKDNEYFRISNFNQGYSYSQVSQKAQGWKENNLPYLNFREFLPATLNSLFNIKSIHFPNEYFGSFSLGKRSDLSSLAQQTTKMENRGKLLGLQNVKYVLSMSDLPKEATSSFKIVFETQVYQDLPPVKIYQNSQFLPRAYLVNKATTLPEQQILQYISTDYFDPKTEVVLEKEVKLAQNDSVPPISSIKLIKDQEESVIYAVTTTHSVILVLTDTFHPGWKATVDGQQVEILRANYAFRALLLSPGEHKVEFEYKPASFYWGAIISITTIFGLIFYGFGYIMLKISKGKVKRLFLK